MILILSSRPSELINYETLEKVNSRKRHRLCMLALNEIQRRFFFMIQPEQVNQGVIDYLEEWRLNLNRDDEQLVFLLKSMFPDVNINLNLKRFTVSLINFIRVLKDDAQKAFSDFQELDRVCSGFGDDPELKLFERSFHAYLYGDFRQKERKFRQLKTSLSPEKLIEGFSAQDKIVIDPVDDFVHACFQFNSNYEKKAGIGHFRFLPRFKHSFTVLLFGMKRKKWISSTNEEITDLLVGLIPGSSRDSIRKYSSPAKKISAKHAIDIQLFS